jgi:hypothetical protein
VLTNVQKKIKRINKKRTYDDSKTPTNLEKRRQTKLTINMTREKVNF